VLLQADHRVGSTGGVPLRFVSLGNTSKVIPNAVSRDRGQPRSKAAFVFLTFKVANPSGDRCEDVLNDIGRVGRFQPRRPAPSINDRAECSDQTIPTVGIHLLDTA